MSDNRRPIKYGNMVVDATRVSIVKTETDPWHEYLLSDGSMIRFKFTLHEVNRIEGLYEADGTPIYSAKWGIMQHVIPADNLMNVRQEGEPRESG